MNRIIEINSRPASPPPFSLSRITYPEFLERMDEDDRTEWVDGEVIELGPASFQHQDLSSFLTALLRHFVEAEGAGSICPAPFQMKTGPDLPGREPDILFVARDHFHRLENTWLNGPADLAVEIVSPESRFRDREEKFHEYEQGGVREYWLIDPAQEQADFYHLNNDGVYRRIPLDVDQVFHSIVLKGFWLRPDWLWKRPLPLLIDVLSRLKLV